MLGSGPMCCVSGASGDAACGVPVAFNKSRIANGVSGDLPAALSTPLTQATAPATIDEAPDVPPKDLV